MFTDFKQKSVNKVFSFFQGLHWVALFRVEETHYEYFDSLGADLEFLKKTLNIDGTIEYNETPVQAENSNTCGLFVTYFVFERIFNFDLSLDDLLNSIFVKEREKNEEIVKKEMAII